VTVSLEQPPAVELREPPEAFDLQLLDRSLELREVLLDAGVGQLGQRLGSKPVDDRPQLAHPCTSNMGSRIRGRS
jgi:hypothetical protein